MKLRFILLVFTILGSFLVPNFVRSAETDSKSKKKPETTEPAKTKGEKAVPKKPKGKSGDTKAKAMPAEVERAEAVLKELPAAKRTALTKLLNSGTKAELTALPGIGETTADAIIKARPLESAAWLVTVKGVGEKTFSEIVKSRK